MFIAVSSKIKIGKSYAFLNIFIAWKDRLQRKQIHIKRNGIFIITKTYAIFANLYLVCTFGVASISSQMIYMTRMKRIHAHACNHAIILLV